MSNSELRSKTRSYVRRLYRRRNDGIFTADDANRLFDRLGVEDSRTRVSVFNSVIASEDVKAVGETTSSRESRRGGKIREFTFTN